MIGYGEMIAMLPGDIRGRLRGTPQSPELREMARMYVEGTGNCCPPSCFDDAVDTWVRLGSPDPEPNPPSCPHCGDRLERVQITVGDAFEATDVLRCDSCDTWLGGRWDTEADLRVQVHGHGHIAGM